MTRDIPGTLVVEADAAAVAKDAAMRIADGLRSALSTRSRAAVALSGGNTPRAAYALLANEPGIDWSRVHVLWVDERVASPTDDRSNYRWAKATLLDAVAGLNPDHVHRMQTDAQDLAGSVTAYETTLRTVVNRDAAGLPAIDVMVLGIGDDGHTASLFPRETTVDIRDRWVAATPARPSREGRMTLTVPIIQNARTVLVLAVGPAKREALAHVWEPEGDVHATPARIIRGCSGALFWIVDASAAA